MNEWNIAFLQGFRIPVWNTGPATKNSKVKTKNPIYCNIYGQFMFAEIKRTIYVRLPRGAITIWPKSIHLLQIRLNYSLSMYAFISDAIDINLAQKHAFWPFSYSER